MLEKDHLARLNALNGGAPPEESYLAADHMPAVLKDIRDRKKRGGKISGLSTGFDALDELLNGLQTQTLNIFGARPKQGKSALEICIARNIAMRGDGVGFFSLEMPRKQLLERFLSIESEIPYKLLTRGQFNENDDGEIEHASMRMECWPLYIDDSTGLTVSKLGDRAKRMVDCNGVEVVFIDYIQLLKPDGKSRGRYEDVSAVAEGIADLRKTLGVPIVAAAQLSRKVVDRSTVSFKNFSAELVRPSDGDLRDSGQLEQSGDVIAFLSRPETALERLKPAKLDMEYEHTLSQWRGRAEIWVQFNRSGESGFVDLRFCGPLMKFTEPQKLQ